MLIVYKFFIWVNLTKDNVFCLQNAVEVYDECSAILPPRSRTKPTTWKAVRANHAACAGRLALRQIYCQGHDNGPSASAKVVTFEAVKFSVL